ncbi:CapA family protein [Bacteroides ovatus]|nr:CapA family protein [Bacteroides ovatus]
MSETRDRRKGARRLIRAGADAIIGHHPHVIQKEEYFRDIQ